MRELPEAISSGYSAATCVQAICIRVRDRGAFAAFGSKRNRRLGEALIKHIEEALHARFTDLERIELFRAGEQDISVAQVQRTGVTMMRIECGEVADDL